MSLIDELQSTLRSMAVRLGPSIVGIGSRQRGSGIIIGDGKVLTNAHNVRGEEVTVQFAGGRLTRGRVAGVDVDGDLAVVDVDTVGAAVLEWADGSAVSQGAIIFGASYASGGGPRVSFGTVTAIGRAFRGPGGRKIEGSIEHTAPLAPGSSGGPIVDTDGRLLGVNTNRLGDGFYLALPADAAMRERVDRLARGESVRRPRLGIVVAPPHVARRLRRAVGLPEHDGLLVRAVEDGSPADKAGIFEGDLIISAAGRDVSDADGLVEALATAAATFEVRIVRGTEEQTVEVDGTALTGES